MEVTQLLQLPFQIIRNVDKFIFNWIHSYKLGKIYYKLGKSLFLQVEAITVTSLENRYIYKFAQNYYKLGQLLKIRADLLQIGAVITKSK